MQDRPGAESDETGQETPVEYVEASQTSAAKPLRARTLVAIATTTVVIAVAVVLAVSLHHSDDDAGLSNTQLLDLIHSASSAMERTPATTFHMTMTLSAQGDQGTIEISGATVRRTKAMRMTMTGPGVRGGAVSIGRVAYIAVPAASIRRNHWKGWLAVRAPSPTPQQQQLAESGPAGLLKALNRVGGTIERKGQHEVAGVSTTEYDFHADLIKQFGSTYRQIFGDATVAKLQSVGLDDVPMKVWLDRQALPRKMSLTIEFDGLSMDEVAYITPTDEAPKIEAPPASDVRFVKSVREFGNTLRQLTAFAAAHSR